MTIEFIKELQKIQERPFARVYEDFLELATSALMRDDENYLQVMGQYRNNEKHGERAADYFANAFGAMMAAYARENIDHLGRAYEEHVSFGENGQFFTPEELCELMAGLMGEGESKVIADPTAGSGRNLIAMMKRCPDGYFVGMDIDRRCVNMCALNLLFRNATGAVVHCNTLSLEGFGGYWLRGTPLGGAMHRMSEQEAQQFLELPLEQREQVIQEKAREGAEKQLSLEL